MTATSAGAVVRSVARTDGDPSGVTTDVDLSAALTDVDLSAALTDDDPNVAPTDGDPIAMRSAVGHVAGGVAVEVKASADAKARAPSHAAAD